jgi:hypothetical protein
MKQLMTLGMVSCILALLATHQACKTSDAADPQPEPQPVVVKGEFKFTTTSGKADYLYNDNGPASSSIQIRASVSANNAPGQILSWGLVIKRNGQTLLNLDSGSQPTVLISFLPGVPMILADTKELVFGWDDYTGMKALFQQEGQYSADLSVKIQCMISSEVTNLQTTIPLTYTRTWTPFL